ncbi:MAG TPA: hypothetical protein VEF90_04295 [Xanthobacteraceae bacterium]|nr:hypothetical protein [Xanthobacteraceae bacterium]
MRHRSQFALLSLILLTGAACVLPATRAGAFAGNNGAAADPGFVPDSGQINRGFDEQLPTHSQLRPIPTPAQVRAALAMPDSDQAALGANANATTGSAAASAQPSAPIGATGQTMPAKFSQRNDTLDRAPIMALPIGLSDAERRRIYQAAMADNTPLAIDAAQLVLTSELNAEQALRDMHPLPERVRRIAGVARLDYLKTKDKVFLVEPDTRIVVDEIGS